MNRPTIEDVLRATMAETGWSRAQILARGKSSDHPKARPAFLLVAYDITGSTAADVARFAGISAQTIHQTLQRNAEQAALNEDFADLCERIACRAWELANEMVAA